MVIVQPYTVMEKEMETLLWKETELGEIEQVTSIPKNTNTTFYLSITKPERFTLDQWKNFFVVLFFNKERNIHVLHLCKQKNSIIRNGMTDQCSGNETIDLVKKVCSDLGIRRIYIEDEASIFIGDETILLSDREDVLYGSWSWYLRFFDIEDEELKNRIEKRKSDINRLSSKFLEKEDLLSLSFCDATQTYAKEIKNNYSSFIKKCLSYLKSQGISFESRNFVGVPKMNR